MPTVVQFTEPHQVELVDVPAEDLPPGHVRVRTWYSGISAGTELTAYRGTNPYLTKSWDPAERLFVAGAPSFGYPVRGWGYSEVGEVIEVADDVEVLSPGAVVAGIWGHRSEGLLPVAAPHWRRVPEGADPLHGVFARLGAIALNAVLAADSRLGENVVVFGQGVIGLLATQLARRSGARVLAVDAIGSRLALARRLGAAEAIPADSPGGAGAAVRRLTGTAGADSAIELSGSYRALHEAIRSVVVDGTVVASGFYQGDGTGLRLGEEFHHNRVRIIASQIGGAPLALGPRWDQRRLVGTFLDEVASGEVRVDELISHVLDVDKVAEAFRLIDSSPADALQVVLRFPAAPTGRR
ncbi:MAG TPA: zinc-binding alcohol dehydrogenase [Nocardioidaceae bacterium]|nr:zinc-binding alcohol dehydrogenase [Nocardioidaceae bacterium]